MPTVAVVASVAAVAVSAYGVYQGGQIAEEQMGFNREQAGKHANSYYYDSDGNLISSQVWDDAKQGYVARNYESPADKADRLQREGIRKKYLGYLTKTPEEYQKFIEANKKTLGDYYTGKINENFDLAGRNTAESMEARGMTGSRADVDIQSELAKEKGTAVTDAATTVQQYADTQLKDLQNQWWNIVNYAEGAGNAATAQALQNQNVAKGLSDTALRDIYMRTDLMNQAFAKHQNYYGAMTNAGGNLASLGAYYLYNQNNKSPLWYSSPYNKSYTFTDKYNPAWLGGN